MHTFLHLAWSLPHPSSLLVSQWTPEPCTVCCKEHLQCYGSKRRSLIKSIPYPKFSIHLLLCSDLIGSDGSFPPTFIHAFHIITLSSPSFSHCGSQPTASAGGFCLAAMRWPCLLKMLIWEHCQVKEQGKPRRAGMRSQDAHSTGSQGR